MINLKQAGAQLWEATVQCPDGGERKAQSANKNQAKMLACLKCDDAPNLEPPESA